MCSKQDTQLKKTSESNKSFNSYFNSLFMFESVEQ
jgi:hypothetical protein